jgi:tetratricopeptide (TPR) repeat protein
MRDHAIGVPVPENTVRFGIPNACTECHPDRIAQWAASVLASWHPASPRRARLLRRAETFTAARARDQAAVSRLAALADDADEAPVTRANALGYLRLFTDDPRAGAALARGLAADHPLPRAVAALGFVDVAPDDAAKAALIAALGDARRVVRVGAALALASHGVARLPGRDGERLASAQTEYAARAELNPEDAGTLLEVGKFHLAVERWEPAQRTLQEAFAVDPDRPTLRYYLGLALLRRLRVDDGRRMLGKVPPHDPHHATARQLLARLEKLR